jgi:hypothetical protein
MDDFVREGHWVSMSTGEAVEYTNWRTGQPNNDNGHHGGEDCAGLRTDITQGQWDDYFCDGETLGVFCEIE